MMTEGSYSMLFDQRSALNKNTYNLSINYWAYAKYIFCRWYRVR